MSAKKKHIFRTLPTWLPRVTWECHLPAGRALCPGCERTPPARCCGSSAGSARSPDLGPAPARGARPRAASWRSAPPTPPDSAPPGAAAQRTPASSPPTPSESWPAKEGTWRRGMWISLLKILYVYFLLWLWMRFLKASKRIPMTSRFVFRFDLNIY